MTKDVVAIIGRKRSDNVGDYYPTPPVATWSLIRNTRCFFGRKVWEPAAGRGHISRELERLEFQVTSSDLYHHPSPKTEIVTGVDFLKRSPSSRDFSVITNPPYARKGVERFSRRALSVVDGPVAMFTRFQFLESESRYSFFQDPETKPSLILVFSGRINCDEKAAESLDDQIGGMTFYCWVVWETRRPDLTRVEWIDTKRELEKWKESLSEDASDVGSIGSGDISLSPSQSL